MIIKLTSYSSKDEVNYVIDILFKIPDKNQQEKIALKIISLLYRLQHRVFKKVAIKLIELIQPVNLELEYLEIADSLITYIEFVPYFIKDPKMEMDALQKYIIQQISKLLTKGAIRGE